MNINPNDIIKAGILIPCEHTKVQQVGIDLTINTTVTIRHCEAMKVNMNEVVKLPEDMFSLFIHRSSFNRRGILITGSVYDPSYCGICGCTIYNLSGKIITIEKDERIGQMVFFNANPASQYNGQFQMEGIE